MKSPDYRHAVFPICSDVKSRVFGTGFVVYVGPTVDNKATVYLVTCAHVVKDCKGKMTVATQPATEIWTGDRDVLDLALIRVELEVARFPMLHALPVARVRKLDDVTSCDSDSQLRVAGHRPSGQAFRIVPLKAEIDDEPEYVTDATGVALTLIRFNLPQAASIEPLELEKGYSGAPLLTAAGVCAVFDTRRRTAGETTFKSGTAFPIWPLVDNWPDMPDEVGRQLFGNDYWPILSALYANRSTWHPADMRTAFLTAVDDAFPEDFTLGGCAVTISQLENPDHPTRRLQRFVRTLAECTDSPELVDVLPPQTDESTAGLPVLTSGKVYRRLIIRILERRLSSRSANQRGRRYETQIHTSTCQPENGNDCDRYCIDCAPFAAGKLVTVKNRTLDETSKSGLGELLQAELQDLLGIFGAHEPDLVQIVAPESLLPFLIFDAQLDQMDAWGSRPMYLLYPTVFSGQCRSDPMAEGRKLKLRLGAQGSPWTGDLAIVQSVGEMHKLLKQLADERTVIAITTDREMADKCLYSDVPIITIPWADSQEAQQTIERTECLRRLPRVLHTACHPLSLVYDTPNVPIQFARDELVIAGN